MNLVTVAFGFALIIGGVTSATRKQAMIPIVAMLASGVTFVIIGAMGRSVPLLSWFGY